MKNDVWLFLALHRHILQDGYACGSGGEAISCLEGSEPEFYCCVMGLLVNINGLHDSRCSGVADKCMKKWVCTDPSHTKEWFDKMVANYRLLM
jgi:hypothetical protein